MRRTKIHHLKFVLWGLLSLLMIAGALMLTSCVHRHEFGQWVTVKRPTCTEKGLHERRCECGQVRQDIIPALSHKEGGWVTVTPPTCTSEGSRTKSCMTCHTVMATQSIARIEHKTVYHLGMEPSCEDGGWSAYHTCLNCDYTTYKEIAPLGHNVVYHEGRAPTCTEEGFRDYVTCSRCSYTTYETIPATGHDVKNGACRKCDWAEESGGLEFSSNDDGTCEVVGIGTFTGTRLVIPATSPNGETVTAIGRSAFNDCKTITSVVIPEGVTTIKAYAFYKCSKLTQITIADSVTTIEGGAFNGCSALTEITLPAKLTTLRNGVFMDCIKLKSIVIPEGVTVLDKGTFNACLALESVTLPEAMTTLGGNSFYQCIALQSIILPDSMTNVGAATFQRCESLESIVIGIGVKTIDRAAFAECTALRAVFYRGTQTDRNEITINAESNQARLDATWYYYSETEPTTEGNFWHYVDGAPAVWGDNPSSPRAED